MLNKLTIQNVALIPYLELNFCSQLNILSGETGAGKSIIVDSLLLLLGNRYDKTLLSYGREHGYVEGVFDSSDKSNAILQEWGFDSDDIVIVTRKFHADGKNEIRINGRAATTGMLKQLTSVLVDIYGQNESQTLIRQTEHLRILDYYVRAQAEPIKQALKAEYTKYREITAQLGELGDLDDRARTIDLLRYQIEEIAAAKVQKGEEDDLLTYRKKVASAEKINTVLAAVVAFLSEREDGDSVQELLGDALHQLGGITDLSPVYDELYERLHSVSIELSDIADSARAEIEDLNFDFDELETLEKRLELLRSLKRKYGDYEKMTQFRADSEQRLYTLENCTEIFEKLSREKQACIERLYDLSLQLHAVRENGAQDFAKRLIGELNELGMNQCAFEIRFDALPNKDTCEAHLSPNGLDRAEFYLSPNKGQPLKPLIKIISGGEMSRFMLALKVVSSQTEDIPTMIFDEIDAGISGKIGQEVAKKLAVLSRNHQVLCVTHLPQIASMADTHYFIEKTEVDNVTETKVRALTLEEMIDEVSRLSGAKDISTQSTQNAKQMKEWSENFKNELR